MRMVQIDATYNSLEDVDLFGFNNAIVRQQFTFYWCKREYTKIFSGAADVNDYSDDFFFTMSKGSSVIIVHRLTSEQLVSSNWGRPWLILVKSGEEQWKPYAKRYISYDGKIWERKSRVKGKWTVTEY